MYQLQKSQKNWFIFTGANKFSNLFLVQTRILAQERSNALWFFAEQAVLLKVRDTLAGLLVEQLCACCVDLRGRRARVMRG